MNLRTLAFATSLVIAGSAFADDNIRFVPEPYPIGQADQGEVKHVVLKGANVSGKEINLESVMGQGVGMSNFKFPKKIAKGAAVAIEFETLRHLKNVIAKQKLSSPSESSSTEAQ